MQIVADTFNLYSVPLQGMPQPRTYRGLVVPDSRALLPELCQLYAVFLAQPRISGCCGNTCRSLAYACIASISLALLLFCGVCSGVREVPICHGSSRRYLADAAAVPCNRLLRLSTRNSLA